MLFMIILLIFGATETEIMIYYKIPTCSFYPCLHLPRSILYHIYIRSILFAALFDMSMFSLALSFTIR